MPKVLKPHRGGPTKADLNRYLRVSLVRDRTVRAVGGAPAAPLAVPATHDRLRQTFVALYHALFLSPRAEPEVALEYFRCCRHLIEGGDVDTLPLTLVSREVFRQRLAHALDTGTILNE